MAAVATAAGVALLPAATTASTTAPTIVTPTAGQSISLRHNPYTPIAGGVAFAPANPTSSTFFLRRDGCGTASDNPHLSRTSGTDGGDGCGLTLSSFVGLGGTADQSAFVDFPSQGGMPLSLDASRNVSGTIDLQSVGLVNGLGAGAGQLTVDISMEALVNGNGVPLGSTSQSVLITPAAADYPVQFSIQPNGALNRTDLQGVDLRVHVQGPFVFSGFIGTSGKSWAAVPSYTASVNRFVQVSLDDATFSHPIAARLDSSGSSWSVAIQTPAVGRHTLYVEDTQGFTTSAVAARTFKVTR
jgi:hypothetical protein